MSALLRGAAIVGSVMICAGIVGLYFAWVAFWSQPAGVIIWTNGAVGGVAMIGFDRPGKCIFDNLPVVGHKFGASWKESGRCHDLGADPAPPKEGAL